jgi:UDP-N-acetylglucosamine diphosphorylase / glucose-1-phosphate thymidylyltransferase / UDP-N-acetylgalactosamine diphosphorylase / glucosamine-1-phosphate N-acetyltransferase / galactosamine-1-phosphate N-acetyltransferase
MHVVIFEGSQWASFAPLSLSRPVFMLASGMTTLLDKQIRHTKPTRLSLWVRPELEEATRLRIAPRLGIPTTVNTPLDSEPALLISGRTLHLRPYDSHDGEWVVLDGGEFVRSARVVRPGLSAADVIGRTESWQQVLKLPQAQPQTRLVEHLWDLINWNEESLLEDSARVAREKRALPKGAYHVVEPENIWIGDGAKLNPGVVLDASRGPVVVDRLAEIGANSVLLGPCYVGPQARVAPLSYLRQGTSIGMMCKVGGEIANSILFGYSNKPHYGFLGDSYVGKWVNMGAGATTSNLKNTYGEITVRTPKGELKTGRRFLGALIGDHSKVGIGARIMAGSYLGFSSNLAGSGIPPRYVGSFRFWTDRGMDPYRTDKAWEVVNMVYARRNRKADDLDRAIFDYVAATAPSIEGGT